jgi:uncharacterized protein (DUF305 family)
LPPPPPCCKRARRESPDATDPAQAPAPHREPATGGASSAGDGGGGPGGDPLNVYGIGTSPAETWYDQVAQATRSTSRAHYCRRMPDLTLRSRSSPTDATTTLMNALPLRSALLLLGMMSACTAPTHTPTAQAPGTVSAAEFEAIYQARADSMRALFTPADVRFMADMIHHHAQALEMAAMAPSHGASAQIQTLAARIFNGQQDEIRTMQAWLRERGQPVPEVSGHEGHAPAGQHAGHGHVHGAHGHAAEHAGMPGMLTPEQMARLHQARGAEFDRLFLTLMIQHHRGAVQMVHELFATDGAGQDDTVFRFASDVQVDQATEIARMEQMLSRMGADSHAH